MRWPHVDSLSARVQIGLRLLASTSVAGNNLVETPSVTLAVKCQAVGSMDAPLGACPLVLQVIEGRPLHQSLSVEPPAQMSTQPKSNQYKQQQTGRVYTFDEHIGPYTTNNIERATTMSQLQDKPRQ